MGPTRCPETSVNNYLTTPCNHPKDHRLQHRGASLKSILDICFDDILHTTLYAQATIVSGIAAYQEEFRSPSFIQNNFFSGMSVESLYNRTTQRQTISTILGSTVLGDQYIAETDFYLTRGHISAKTDFVYGSQQRATFHFVNISP
jgi:hypothetical protein